MSEITVTLPDGSNRRVPAGTTPGEIAAGISPRLAKAALAAAVDDRLVDLSFPLQQDARVRIITPESPEGLHVYRHSTAHLLAAAVTNLFPGAQCGIGPATDEGFFYDFIVDRPVRTGGPRGDRKEDEGPRRARICATSDRCWPRDEAKQFFAGRGETLKVQLIDEKTEGQSEVSCYTIKDRDTFVDFCVGPHVPSSGRLKAFKLLNTSNAYWKGDARNQPMQRIYGTAFFSDKELQAHLQRLEEAKKRDHRKVGKEIGPVHVPCMGAGCDVLARQGNDAVQHARQLHARRALPCRLRGVENAADLQQGVVGDVRPLAALPREHVPRHRARR